jgi:hypothetical protein
MEIIIIIFIFVIAHKWKLFLLFLFFGQANGSFDLSKINTLFDLRCKQQNKKIESLEYK